MTALKHLKRAAKTSAIWSTIDEYGGVIIDDFLAPELLTRLQSDFAPLVSNHPPGAATGHDFWKNFHGSETKRITGLAEVSTSWGELLCDPLYKEMGDHYLGEDNYYLNTGQLICIDRNYCTATNSTGLKPQCKIGKSQLPPFLPSPTSPKKTAPPL